MLIADLVTDIVSRVCVYQHRLHRGLHAINYVLANQYKIDSLDPQ